jgi:hypothetical protein
MSTFTLPKKTYTTPNGVEVQYAPYKDYEPDNVKIFHDFDRVSDGKFHMHLDWSPYSTPSENDLEIWFKLGCPTRDSIGDGKGSGNLDSDRLVEAMGRDLCIEGY